MFTTLAAPTNFTQPSVESDAAKTLAQIFDRLARWQTIHTVLQGGTLVTHLLALHSMLQTEP